MLVSLGGYLNHLTAKANGGVSLRVDISIGEHLPGTYMVCSWDQGK